MPENIIAIRKLVGTLLESVDHLGKSPREYESIWGAYSEQVSDLSGALHQFLHDTREDRG